MNQPAAQSLIPLTVGEILDKGFRLLPVMVKTLWPLCLLAALFLPLALYFQHQGTDLTDKLLYLGLVVCSSIAYGALLPLFIFVAEEAWLTGDAKLVIARSRYTLWFLPQLVVLSLWTALIFTFGLLLFVIPGLIYIANRFLATYILILEKNGVEAALQRSKKLMTKERWYSLHGPLARLSGLGIVTLLISVMCTLFNSSGELIISTAVAGDYTTILALTASLVGTFLYYLLSLFSLTVYVGFYYDLRVRYEGIDLLHEPTSSDLSTKAL